jgi:hypothetical protein
MLIFKNSLAPSSGGNFAPLRKGGRSVEFENLAIAKVAFLVEMVVDRRLNGNELF